VKPLTLTTLLEGERPDPYASRAAEDIGRAGAKARKRYEGESPQARRSRIKDYVKIARDAKVRADTDRDRDQERRYGMDY